MKNMVVTGQVWGLRAPHRSRSGPLTAKDDQVWGVTGWRRPGGLELGHRMQLTLTQHPQGAAGALWECGVGGVGGKCGRPCSCWHQLSTHRVRLVRCGRGGSKSVGSYVELRQTDRFSNAELGAE